jgi:galactokinase
MRQFRDICFPNDERMSGAVPWELGKVVNESRTSYDCSCPELDELTRICRDAGVCRSRHRTESLSL